MRLFPLCFILPILSMGCDGESRAEEVSQFAEDCGGAGSNLEYSDCLENLAQEAQGQVALEFTKTIDLAKAADEEYSWGYTGSEPDPEDRLTALLKQSQDDWRRYSENQCELEATTSRGGSGTRSLRAKCILRLARERISELQASQFLIDRSR